MENESGYEAGSEISSSFTSDESVSDTPVTPPEEEKKPCQKCGSDAKEDLIMTCVHCNETREHTYCARVQFRRVPATWMCEDCRNSRINQVEKSMDKEDSVDQTAPLSGINQEEKKPCQICGSNADELKIMTCIKCRETREHIYCARVKLQSVPFMWLCEACRNPSPIPEPVDQTARTVPLGVPDVHITFQAKNLLQKKNLENE